MHPVNSGDEIVGYTLLAMAAVAYANYLISRWRTPKGPRKNYGSFPVTGAKE